MMMMMMMKKKTPQLPASRLKQYMVRMVMFMFFVQVGQGG